MGPDLSNLNPDADDTLTTFLSSRAEERFQLLERGEIGERLSLSPRTVDTHLAHVYRKLGIAGRTEIGAALAGTG